MAKPGLDPRIVRTRRLLRNAFVELLQETEIEKITVNRIAERATINRVTFYLHYRDIPDMLHKMAEEMIEDIQRITGGGEDRSGGMAEADWPEMVRLLEHIAENAVFFKVILTKRIPIFTERLIKLFTQLIKSRIETEGSDSFASTAGGVKKDIALWYCSSALIGTIIGWLRNDMPYTPLFISNQISLLLPRL